MVKGKDPYCPNCGQHWTVCADGHAPAPHVPHVDWDWDAPPRPTGAPRQRTRSKSAGRAQDGAWKKKGKGAGKQQRGSNPDGKASGKGKGDHKGPGKSLDEPTGLGAPSPFAIYQASPLLTPWVQEGASASAETTPASASSSNANSELLAAVAKAFPDKSQMPEELRDLVEKANLQSSKSITKDLHSATSSLGKSKKLLQEVVEAKKAHKQAWTRHLSESLELWQKQLQDFTQQQAMLAEKENKAIRDIQLANKSIQNLNLQAAGTEGPMNVSTLEPAPPANPDLSTQKDKEMIDLQKKLQKCFGECMVATGLKEAKDLVEEIADSEDDEEKKRKRQKSLDRRDGAS